MCGICGILNWVARTESLDRIRAMNNLAAHRGPDGEGYKIQPGIALGHRRLAILDLNIRGQQPMCWSNRYWIVFNGEIYNYLEIRAELISLGHTFETETDTEVILAAFAKWGVHCLPKFNGMWAFAIHDKEEKTVFLARDRFGVKPLYIAEQNDEFAFSSEIKQLLPLLPKVRANQAVLLEWLLTGYENHRPETMFEGVTSLPAAHWMKISLKDGTRTTKRYYELRKSERFANMSFESAQSELRELFTDAIRIRLRSDVQVGTCLSGGLDSSATSVIASEIYHKQTGLQFWGVHARASEEAIDESSYASMVAQHSGIDLSVICPSIEDFRATVDEVVYTQEEPFGSPSMFMGWHVFREARARSCPVMLNGQGGDEVLLGYERYFAAFAKGLPLWKYLIEAILQARHSRLNLATVLKHRFYFNNPKLRLRWLAKRTFLSAKYIAKVNTQFINRQTEAFQSVWDLQRFEVEFQLPHLLRYEDRNSMRHSIETRLPFLDYRMVEACLSMPPQYKIHNGWTKYILRMAIKKLLPKMVVWRSTKLGFEAPTETWLRASDKLVRDEISNSKILTKITDHDRMMNKLSKTSLKQQWMLYNIAVWERIYGVHWD